MTIQLLKSIAEKVRPPRALWVPFAHGYPLEAPLEPEKQKGVMRAALELAHAKGEVPLLVDYNG